MSEEKHRVIGIVDVYTFAIQVIAKNKKCNAWNDDPAIAVHSYGQRIVSANKRAKSFRIDNNTRRREAEEILSTNHRYDLKIYEIPAYPTQKPDQTLLRTAAKSILYEVLEVIPQSTIKWDKPPIVEWIPLDEIYFDLTEQIDYVIEQGNYEQILYPNGMNRHMYSKFGENVVRVPEEAVSNPGGSTAYPLNSSKDSTSRLFFGLRYFPTKIPDIRRALGTYYICKIMAHIYNRTGLHCSGGLGPNKMIAKIACSITQPGTLLFVSRDMFKKPKHTSEVGIKKLAAIDPEIRRILKDSGIETLKDLREVVRNKNIFAMNLEQNQLNQIQQALLGHDDRPVIEKHATKNINTARNFAFRPLQNRNQVLFQLKWLLKEFQDRLREEELGAKGRKPEMMFVAISYEDLPEPRRFRLTDISITANKLVRKINTTKNIIKIRLSGTRLQNLQQVTKCLSVMVQLIENLNEMTLTG